MRSTSKKVLAPCAGIVVLSVAALGPIQFPVWAWVARNTPMDGGVQLVSTLIAVASLLAACVGLRLVYGQLQGANRMMAAQASIQVQARFKESYDARVEVYKTFPVHSSLGVSPVDGIVWTYLEDLDESHEKAARQVIGALNDVAQYVSDGLPLRSALRQYHTIFVRLGWLLLPYVKEVNRSIGGATPTREGVRVAILMNAALVYHQTNPLHWDKVLVLERSRCAGDPDIFVLLDLPNGLTLDQSDLFGKGGILPTSSMGAAIDAAERALRA